MPVIVRMTNATKEMPPRQYSGYQYQIVLSSYFSAWLRGSCRWSVSTTTRVRSAYGTVGNRDLIQPKIERPVSCRMSPVVDVLLTSTVYVPCWVRHSADQVLALGLDRDDRQGPRGRTVHALGAHIARVVLGIHVHDQQERVVLGPVADAVDRVLPELHVRRRRDDVVPVRRRVVDHMPPRVAAQVHAPVEQHDDPRAVVRRVERRIVEVQAEAVVERRRDLCARRGREVRALPLDSDDQARKPGAGDPRVVLEQAPPHARGALPLLVEVGDLDRRAC